MTSATDLVVATRDLTKTFAGRTVVDSLDLAVPSGAVYGFLGPNGSGKSTTMKMLLALLTPTRGEVELFGQPLTRASRAPLMTRIGSMIERPPGYEHLTGEENMRLIQHMLDLDDAAVDRALAVVHLSAHKKRLVKTYSLGMKQRLGIAIALARQPELLILDEPTNGLDPAGIEEIRTLIVHLAGEGVSLMVSSHLLDEIDKTATSLGILSAGRLVFQGTRSELFTRALPDLLIRTSRPREAVAALTAPGARIRGGRPDAVELANSGVRLQGIDEDGAALAVRTLVQAEVPVYEVTRAAQTLEELFMELTEAGGL